MIEELTLQQRYGIRFLTEADLRQLALQALRQTEAQLFTACMNLAMDPANDSLQSQCAGLSEEFKRLQDYLQPLLPQDE